MYGNFVYVVVGEDKLDGRIHDWYGACRSPARAIEMVQEAEETSVDPDLEYTWYSVLEDEEKVE